MTVENLYETMVDPTVVKDSFEKRTVPTGTYTLKIERADVRTLPEEFTHGGLDVITIGGSLLASDGQRAGRSPLFDVTWHKVINPKTGKQDQMSNLFGQLAVALDMRNKSVGEVRDAALAYPVSVYIRESFKTAEGWRTASTPEERAAYRQAGLEARNFVSNISKVQG